jgi:hypothetical protein
MKINANTLDGPAALDVSMADVISRRGPLEALRPTARAVIDAQNLNDILLQPIRDNEWRPGDDEFARARDVAGSPHLRIVGK